MLHKQVTGDRRNAARTKTVGRRLVAALLTIGFGPLSASAVAAGTDDSVAGGSVAGGGSASESVGEVSAEATEFTEVTESMAAAAGQPLDEGEEKRVYATRVDLPSDIALVAVTWDEGAEAPRVIELRYLANGSWSGWQQLEAEQGQAWAIREGSEPYLLTNADAVEAVVQTVAGDPVAGLALTVIGTTADESGAAVASSRADGLTFDTGTHGLIINTRKAWGANEAQMTWKPTVAAVNGAVVHHTAGGNNYTQAQVPQQIRNIYHYHAVTLGWGDIGYNLIVDRYGGVWEGRAGGLTKAIQGAHARGANSRTFGITVMGDYDAAAPPSAAITAMNKAIAWKLHNHGIGTSTKSIWVEHEDGLGRTVPLVSAHRDVGWTTCPGNAFYARMPSIRDDVARYLDAIVDRDVTVTRLGGRDRFATNLAVNKVTAAAQAPVFIASGQSFADVLSVAPAVRANSGALYLTQSTTLPSATLNAIAAGAPSAIYVVGGPGAVSDQVLSQLRTRVPSAQTVTRIGGKDRYETSALILQTFYGAASNEIVFVASGRDYPDALSAAAAAGALGAPVLLVDGATGGVSSTARAALTSGASEKILVVVGGASVVSSAARDSLVEQISGASATRLSGRDRYQTNLAVNEYLSERTGTAPTGIWVATGRDFPDALSAAVPAAEQDQRLVLSSGTCLPSPIVSSWIDADESQITDVRLVGGTGVLGVAVERLVECEG